MNKIDIKAIKKLKLSKGDVSRIFLFVSDHRRLMFMIFWGMILVYSFEVLYKKVYIEIQFIDYSHTESAGVGREMTTLNKISEGIDARREIRLRAKDKTYRDPFKYAGDTALDSSLSTPSLGTDSVLGGNNAVPSGW